MNNKGQSLVIFILVLPLFFTIVFCIKDLFTVRYEKNKLRSLAQTSILYVMKDRVERKCIVKTLQNEILVNKTLSEIKKELDERFYESHRSCIINTRRLDRIDWKNNIIYFENGCNIDLISRDKKKGLKEYRKC